MKTLRLDLNEVTEVKVWERDGKVRLYLKINGVSAYQQKKGSCFIELYNGEWVGNYITKGYCPDLLASLENLTLEQVKEILKNGFIEIEEEETALNLGYEYGMTIVNGGVDLEDITADFGTPYVQSDFIETMEEIKNIKIDEEFIKENLNDIEAGYHSALKKIGYKNE